MAVTLYKPQNKYEHSLFSLQRERNLVLRQPIQDSRSLKYDQENREHLKYLRNVYCVMTVTAKIKTHELATKPQTNKDGIHQEIE